MTLFKKTITGDGLRNFNVVITYAFGKAIIQNEKDRLFFIECDESFFTIGSFVENSLMTPLEVLPDTEKKLIYSFLEEEGMI